MRDDLTEVVVVLDRSGSMGNVIEDTVGGLKQFVKDQAELDGEVNFTLVQFDTEYEIVKDGVSLKADILDDYEFVPRAMTALLDALGKTINDVGARLKSTDEKDRPSKVIFVIITDGLENASREFSRSQVMEMIKHQTDKYQWEFVYLGAGQDAIAVAGDLGIRAGSAMTYLSNDVGTKQVYGVVSQSVGSYRSGDIKTGGDFISQSNRDEANKIINENKT